jgi:hypothetical protein
MPKATFLPDQPSYTQPRVKCRVSDNSDTAMSRNLTKVAGKKKTSTAAGKEPCLIGEKFAYSYTKAERRSRVVQEFSCRNLEKVHRNLKKLTTYIESKTF